MMFKETGSLDSGIPKIPLIISDGTMYGTIHRTIHHGEIYGAISGTMDDDKGHVRNPPVTGSCFIKQRVSPLF